MLLVHATTATISYFNVVPGLLPGNKLMMVGGYTSNPSILTDMAEMATVW